MIQIIQQLQKKLKEESISVLKLSKETGISAYKIYKWLDGKAKPKHDDVVTIEGWLRNEKEIVPQETVVRHGVNLNEEIGILRESLISIQAHLEVFESAIAGLMSKEKGDFIQKVSELREEVRKAANRRFDELNKK